MASNLEFCQIIANIKSQSSPSDKDSSVQHLVILIQSNPDTVDLTQLAEVIEMLRNDVKRLTDQNDALKKDVDCLQKSLNTLLSGQIVSKFEKVFVSEILKDSGLSAMCMNRLTFKQVRKMIKRKEVFDTFPLDELAAKKAKDQWTYLDQNHDLDHNDYNFISHIKTKRVSVAHPKVTLKEAFQVLRKLDPEKLEEDEQPKLEKYLQILEEYSVDMLDY